MDMQDLNQTPPPHTHKILWTVIGVLLLVVIVGGYYWWQEIKQTANSEQIIQNSPSTSSGQSAVPSDWKTYTNTEYGFEIKYPVDWLLNNSAATGISLASPVKKTTGLGIRDTDRMSISVYSSFSEILQGYGGQENINSTNLADFLAKAKEVHAADVGDFHAMQFNEIPAFEVILTGESSYYSIFIELNNLIYVIIFGEAKSRSQLTEIDNQILSTFKFTK